MRLKPYHEKIIASKHDDETAILSLLKASIDSDRNTLLPLQNVFKGIPISNRSELFDVNNRCAEFKTNPLQIAAIQSAAETIIRHPSINNAVIGKLNYIDTLRNIVSLKEFTFAHVHFDMRAAVRVQLQPPLRVILNVDDNKVSGEIRDISVDGCNLSTPVGSILEQGTSITLNLKFMHNNVTKDAWIPARVLRVHQGLPCDCIMLFEHTPETENVLSCFLNQCQIEIIRELKEKSEK